jgi:TDG/mug DNA glycosylase family protein
MLDDLFGADLLVVFCGTAAGNQSAMLGQYYAGRGNRFWDILAATKLTPSRLAPADYRRLGEFGIGLTDIAKGRAGNDTDIAFRPADREQLRDKLRQYRPRILCFNGKRAAQEFFGVKSVSYGLQPEGIGPTALFVAPSTSGAARGSWDEGLWHELALLVQHFRTETRR